MKKVFYIIAILLLGAVSCTKEEEVRPGEGAIPDAEGSVEVTISARFPENIVATRSLDDTPDFRNMRIAVFGSSGFLKQYALANILNLDNPRYDEESDPNHLQPIYDYTVNLQLSSAPRIIHFIVNGPDEIPFSSETDDLSSLLVNNDFDDSYWQRKEVSGIFAKTNDEGQYIDKDGNVTTDNFVPADRTLDDFTNVPLVRNFAKFVLESSDNGFKAISYAVANVPKKGNIAPYNTTDGSFVEDFQTKTYSDLRAFYPGRLVESVELKTVPDETDFVPYNAAVATSERAGVYCYERPAVRNADEQTFIILKAEYPKDSGNEYYYRINLSSESNLLTIYRNFVYTVKVTALNNIGEESAEDAYNSDGSGNISDISSMASLSDISDGIARIVVEYTENTIIEGDSTEEFSYSFTETVTEDGESVTQGRADHVKAYFLDADGKVVQEGNEAYAAGTIIKGTLNVDPADSKESGTISFKTRPTPTYAEGVQTQKIRVEGTKTDGTTLYRDITFKLMPLQLMDVTCVPHVDVGPLGAALDVIVKLHNADLPRSIFPLQFTIEASGSSLTPDNTHANNNLPVTVGKSTIPGNGGNAYCFNKTLSYDEYRAGCDPDDNTSTFHAYFTTSKDISDSYVWVSNKWFVQNYGNFSTVGGQQQTYDFSNLSFSENGIKEDGHLVFFRFDAESSHIPETVTVRLTNLKPADDETHMTANGDGTYTYTMDIAGSSNHGIIRLVTVGTTGNHRVQLSATNYYDAELKMKHKFTGTYTVNLRTNNGDSPSFTTNDYVSVVFKNTVQGGTGNNNRYQEMGNREWNGFLIFGSYEYFNGEISISSKSSEIEITGVSWNYTDTSHNRRAVTVNGTSLSGNSWSGSESNVNVIMSCTSGDEYDNRNRINSLTINYVYWE